MKYKINLDILETREVTGDIVLILVMAKIMPD